MSQARSIFRAIRSATPAPPSSPITPFHAANDYLATRAVRFHVSPTAGIKHTRDEENQDANENEKDDLAAPFNKKPRGAAIVYGPTGRTRKTFHTLTGKPCDEFGSVLGPNEVPTVRYQTPDEEEEEEEEKETTGTQMPLPATASNPPSPVGPGPYNEINFDPAGVDYSPVSPHLGGDYSTSPSYRPSDLPGRPISPPPLDLTASADDFINESDSEE